MRKSSGLFRVQYVINLNIILFNAGDFFPLFWTPQKTKSILIVSLKMIQQDFQ